MKDNRNTNEVAAEEPGEIFHATTERGKGQMRNAGRTTDDLFQIRCPFVDTDWSSPMSLDRIRGHYCYEGARCVIDSVVEAVNKKREGHGE